MIMRCVNELLGQDRPRAQGPRVHHRRQLRLPVGAAVRLRVQHRRRRRVAAGVREPRRDGRRVGAVRGVAAAPARRHRRRARDRLGQVVAGPAPRGVPAADRPLLDGAARHRSGLAGRHPGPRACIDAGQGHRARLRRGGRRAAAATRWPTRTRRWPVDRSVDSLLAEPYFSAPLRQHDLPPISDGAAARHHRRRRPGPRSLTEPSGVDPGHGPPHRVASSRPARPHDVGVDRAGRGAGAGVHDGPVDVAELMRRPTAPRRSSCAPRSASRDDVASTRRAARSPAIR